MTKMNKIPPPPPSLPPRIIYSDGRAGKPKDYLAWAGDNEERLLSLKAWMPELFEEKKELKQKTLIEETRRLRRCFVVCIGRAFPFIISFNKN